MQLLDRILVVETSFPGDAVISTAVAVEIKRLKPQAHVTYLVRPEVAELMRYAPAVDQVIAFDKYGADAGRAGVDRFAQNLRKQAFDVAFVLNPSVRNRSLIQHSKVPLVRWLDGSNPDGKPRSEILLSILTQDFSSRSLATLPRLNPPPSDRKLLQDYIVLAPGSVWATKCWGDEKFQALVALYELAGIPSVIIGGMNDRPKGERVACGNSMVIDLTGKTSLVEAASIITGARLVIANDSAPVHIATAVRTPVVAIFGPTVPEFGFLPPQAMGRVMQTDLWCRPCTSHGPETCPIYTHDCMKLISVEEVLHAGAELFNEAAA
jgi:heptosyltransferase-2